MPCEIELKAHVDDFAAVETSLRTFARYLHQFDKSDTYFRKPVAGTDVPLSVRVRNDVITSPRGEESRFHVTYKDKKRSGGIEVNAETEFSVSDPAAAESLIIELGAVFAYRKRKEGTAFESDGVFCELCRIDGLGDFLELEIISDSDAPATVAAARDRLLSVLDRTGIPREKIEERFYSELLGV